MFSAFVGQVDRPTSLIFLTRRTERKTLNRRPPAGRRPYGVCRGTPSCEGCSCNSGNQTGTSGPDTLYGTADNNCLYGLAGDDVLYGYAGNDKLFGMADDDELYGGSGEDCLYGGDYGDDYLDGGSGSDFCTQGETYVSCND